MADDDFPRGTVWLVGAGPGDPELLTRHAERLIGRASVIFHDSLVGRTSSLWRRAMSGSSRSASAPGGIRRTRWPSTRCWSRQRWPENEWSV